MTDAIRTIQFNTGRKYTEEGQIITATLYSDGVATFYDASRMIDGEVVNETTKALADPALRLADWENMLRHAVFLAYDRGNYAASSRSRHDGMMKGGRNTRDGYDTIRKLAALAKPEDQEGDMQKLVALWTDFCAALDCKAVSADEKLAEVADAHGEAGRAMREWIMDFIIAWENGCDEAEGAYGAFGNGSVHLFEAPTQSEVRGWIKCYTRWGDWGGYGYITLEDDKGNVLETFEKPEGEDDSEDDGVAAQYPDHLDADEREVIDALICAALERGYEVKVRGLTPFTTDYQCITQNVAATDEEHLIFRKQGEEKPFGHVFLVHGNAPSEVIADLTDNLATVELVDVVKPITDRLELEGK